MWWNLIATPGLSGGASEGGRGKLSEALREMLMCPSEDLAQVGAGKLRLISEDHDSNRLIGQPWGAVQVSKMVQISRKVATPHFS